MRRTFSFSLNVRTRPVDLYSILIEPQSLTNASTRPLSEKPNTAVPWVCMGMLAGGRWNISAK